MGRCEFCGRAGKGFGWKDQKLSQAFQVNYFFCGRDHLAEWLKWKDKTMRPDPRETNARIAAIEAVHFKLTEWANKFPGRSLSDLDRDAASILSKVAIENYSECLIVSARGPHDH